MADKTPTDIFTQFAGDDNASLADTEEVNIAGFEHYIKHEFDIPLPQKGEKSERYRRFVYPFSFTFFTLFLTFSFFFLLLFTIINVRQWSWTDIDDLDVREGSYPPSQLPSSVIQNEVSFMNNSG